MAELTAEQRAQIFKARMLGLDSPMKETDIDWIIKNAATGDKDYADLIQMEVAKEEDRPGGAAVAAIPVEDVAARREAEEAAQPPAAAPVPSTRPAAKGADPTPIEVHPYGTTEPEGYLFVTTEYDETLKANVDVYQAPEFHKDHGTYWRVGTDVPPGGAPEDAPAAVHAGEETEADYDFKVVGAGYTADQLKAARAGTASTGEGESNWRVLRPDGKSAGVNAGWLKWRMEEAEALGIDTSGWINAEGFYTGPGPVDLQGQVNQAKIALGTPGAMDPEADPEALAAAMKLAQGQEGNGGNGGNGGSGSRAFDDAIKDIADRLATMEDEARKSAAVLQGLAQANTEAQLAQGAAAQQLDAIDVLSQPRASFFSQFARAPLSTAEKPVSIQAGPELSAVMRGQPIAPYGTIEGPFETIENRPEAIRRAFEGAVERITSETITGMTPTALQQLGVLGQIGGYFPTDVFRAREAAIPKEPRLVRSLQVG
jgi:hypothetical protein